MHAYGYIIRNINHNFVTFKAHEVVDWICQPPWKPWQFPFVGVYLTWALATHADFTLTRLVRATCWLSSYVSHNVQLNAGMIRCTLPTVQDNWFWIQVKVTSFSDCLLGYVCWRTLKSTWRLYIMICMYSLYVTSISRYLNTFTVWIILWK